MFDAGIRVIDLSADFRLRDAALWQQWYGEAHASPQLLEKAVYGLPEVNRAMIRTAQLVACPGCYPTAIQLGFLPLLEQQVVDTSSLIADAKSGVSGAGRAVKLGSLLSEAADSFAAYSVGGHRHLPEIRQGLGAGGGQGCWGGVRTAFGTDESRHFRDAVRAATKLDLDLHALFEKRFKDEPFVNLMPAVEHPQTRSVGALTPAGSRYTVRKTARRWSCSRS